MENKLNPFVVISLSKIFKASGEDIFKAFFAHFKLLLVNPKDNVIKDYKFVVTADNYFALKQIDEIINGEDIKPENESLKKFKAEVDKLGVQGTLKLYRKGKEYDWYLFGKFIEVYEGVLNHEEPEGPAGIEVPKAPKIYGSV